MESNQLITALSFLSEKEIEIALEAASKQRNLGQPSIIGQTYYLKDGRGEVYWICTDISADGIKWGNHYAFRDKQLVMVHKNPIHISAVTCNNSDLSGKLDEFLHSFCTHIRATVGAARSMSSDYDGLAKWNHIFGIIE